jgi:U3 small nucleolar RNA-associated protein 25
MGIGVLANVIPQVRQIFQRIEPSSLAEAADVRFKYFIEDVLPTIRAATTSHTLIFIPSYFDFVRVRNYMNTRHLSICMIGDYSKQSEVSRSRSHFFHGRMDFLLLTERSHFFRRLRIRGVHHVVFYGLPENAQFYSEILNFIEPSPASSASSSSSLASASFSPSNATILALYTKYDSLALERIVGSDRATKLLSSAKLTPMFC